MPLKIKSLNQFRKIRGSVTHVRRLWLKRVVGVEIDPSASLSLASRFLPAKRGSISIGKETLVAFNVLIFTEDTFTGECKPVRIGRRCFIGGGSVITPGVTIADETIVGAGAVVFDNFPPRCIIAGNHAKILKRDIKVGMFGRLDGADEATRRMYY